MMVKHILSFVCVLSAGLVFGQQSQGKVVIEKDSRIDALVAREGAIVPPALNPQIEGFRIQLFFDSERDALNEARSRFFSLYPTIDTYTTYNAPNFFLRVGDFRTRMEAEKIKAEIEDIFPTSFIVQETINLPRLEKEKEKKEQ